MRYSLQLDTEPTAEPITTGEAKSHLRVSTSTDDGYIAGLIKTARQFVEEYTGRALCEQTWIMRADRFPNGSAKNDDWWEGSRKGIVADYQGDGGREIEVPKAPLREVAYVKTYGDDDEATTFYDPITTDDVIVDVSSQPGRIVLKTSSSWPTGLRPALGIEIKFECGYGDPDDVPSPLKQAIYYLVSHMYENREPLLIGSISKELELGLKPMLDQYRLVAPL